jgi:RES domain-containing protein
VHIDPAAQVPELVALSIKVPLADIQTFKPPTAHKDAMSFPWQLREIRASGDRWLEDASSPIIRVPSSIVPIESNFLINPEHSAFKKYTISAAQPFPIDHRFLVR